MQLINIASAFGTQHAFNRATTKEKLFKNQKGAVFQRLTKKSLDKR
jgi:hypothetical protein